jgi:hypothetical protein
VLAGINRMRPIAMTTFAAIPRVAATGPRYWSGLIYVETTRDSDYPWARIPVAAGFDRASFSPRALRHGPSGAPRITRAAPAMVSSER